MLLYKLTQHNVFILLTRPFFFFSFTSLPTNEIKIKTRCRIFVKSLFNFEIFTIVIFLLVDR